MLLLSHTSSQGYLRIGEGTPRNLDHTSNLDDLDVCNLSAHDPRYVVVRDPTDPLGRRRPARTCTPKGKGIQDCAAALLVHQKRGKVVCCPPKGYLRLGEGYQTLTAALLVSQVEGGVVLKDVLGLSPCANVRPGCKQGFFPLWF